eukprot:scaffold598_cov318-Pavlova_lutheri.AAC.15
MASCEAMPPAMAARTCNSEAPKRHTSKARSSTSACRSETPRLDANDHASVFRRPTSSSHSEVYTPGIRPCVAWNRSDARSSR